MKASAVMAAAVLGFAAPGASVASAQVGPPAHERYIVVLDGERAGPPEDVAREVALRTNGQVGFIYEHALQGFSITLPAAAAAALRNDPRVRYVEEDDPVRIFAQEIPTGLDRIHNPGTNEGSFPNLTIDGTDDARVNVDVAVIDTGIDYQHPDLNVVAGTNCTYLSGGGPPWARSAFCRDGLGEGDDDHYHGTHVAGTIGALDNGEGVVGVAPGARLWAVKVLDSSGSGYESNIVAGIDWVVHPDRMGQIEVANMSLGGVGHSQAEQDAISAAVNAGVVVVVAAGNDDDDAADYSPAGLDDVVTVSALADFDGVVGGLGSATCRTDGDDTLADFSNWGETIEIAAPGVCIRSTYPIEQGGYGTISGTSMASPHAAGAAALLASGGDLQTRAEVEALVSDLLSAGNLNWTDDSGDRHREPLLDISAFSAETVSGDGGNGGTVNTPPTADFGYGCSDLTCTFTDQSDDSDNDIDGWSWDFGDGNGSTEQNPSHLYGGPGTYSVTLTVTDSAGNINSISQDVTVTSSAGGGLTLSVSAYKVQGLQKADLTWSGASSTNVDVYRDGSLQTTTTNDGAYTDNINRRGGGSYTYKVCEAGTSTCSNEATATF